MKITIDNYEEFALDYLEGNLNTEEHQQFCLFLDQHPEIKESLENFEEIKLPGLSMAMPYKDKLYRSSPNVKRLGFYFRSIAATLLLMVMVAVLWNSPGEKTKDIVQENKVNTTSEIEHKEIPVVTLKSEDKIVSENKADLVKNHPTKKEHKAEISLITDIASLASPDLTNEKVELIEPEKNYDDAQLINLPVTVVFIDKIEIRPIINYTYLIDQRPVFLTIDEEENKKESNFSIGKLLAKANLIPTGLQDEISGSTFREKIIPETYMDLK